MLSERDVYSPRKSSFIKSEVETAKKSEILSPKRQLQISPISEPDFIPNFRKPTKSFSKTGNSALAAFPEKLPMAAQAKRPSFDIKFNQVSNKPKRQNSHQKFLRQDIIDYPRHLRFSSKFESVAKIQHDMRRQKIFHLEFDPSINSQNHLAILEGVYEPNKQITQLSASQNVHEFIRKRGNIDQEPNVKPIKDLVKIFGKCPGYNKNSMIIKSKKPPQMHPTEGRLLTNQEIQEKRDQYKMLKNYARNLVIENRTEKGKEEVKLKLNKEKSKVIDDMIEKKNQQVN